MGGIGLYTDYLRTGVHIMSSNTIIIIQIIGSKDVNGDRHVFITQFIYWCKNNVQYQAFIELCQNVCVWC